MRAIYPQTRVVVVVIIMVPAEVYAAATEGNVFDLFCTINCFELPKVKQIWTIANKMMKNILSYPLINTASF